jgi:hypothetical protein
VVLHEDARCGRHVKSYEVDAETQDLEEGPLHQPHVGGTATVLVPVPLPLGGVLVLGCEFVTYLPGPHRGGNATGGGAGAGGGAGGGAGAGSASVVPAGAAAAAAAAAAPSSVTIAIAATMIRAHGQVDGDGSRHLLADHEGACTDRWD